MQLSSVLEACLREFAVAGPAELRENGARLAPMSGLSWEVRGRSEKPLLHLWSEQLNLTRRVLAITENSELRLALAVERFGRTRPDRLEFLRMEYEQPDRQLSREEFARHIGRLCAHQFPAETLESIISSDDLEHSLSGNYARGVLRRGKERWALFAVPDNEAHRDAARVLTFALLWLDRLRQSAKTKNVTGLRILLPTEAAAPVAHLTAALDPRLPLHLFEREEVMERLRKIEPAEVANFTSWIHPERETQSLLDHAQRELAPLLPASREAISFHPNLSAKEVFLRFRGLAFLRWHESGIFFGSRDLKTKLDASNAKELTQLLRRLETYRRPPASDTRHPLYRAQAERWLEFLVRRDVACIDSVLDSRFAYAQILAAAAGEHGILDVLSATREGRLAILELKTVEHPVLLLQAAKYWLRIKKHLEQGDFLRYGYFAGVELQQHPPLVYLVAPALRFHPATDTLLPYMHPQLRITRVGLSENWRHGLAVVLRQ